MKDPAYVPMLSWKNVMCCICLFVLFLNRAWVTEEFYCLSFWAKLKMLQCWRRLRTEWMHVHCKMVILDACRSRVECYSVDQKHPLKFPASEMGPLEGILESHGTWSYLSFENKNIQFLWYSMCMYMCGICVCACVCRHVVTWPLEDNFWGWPPCLPRESLISSLSLQAWHEYPSPAEPPHWPFKG